MNQSKNGKLSKREIRLAQEMQVREYIERYRPELRDSEIVITPCGNFASVRADAGTKLPKK